MTECVVWQYRNSTDEFWKDMPVEYTLKHESKYQRNVMNFEYVVHYGKNKSKSYNYVIDLNDMTQTNMNTGKVRRLRRYERVLEDAESLMICDGSD